jgi:hypothetical protein
LSKDIQEALSVSPKTKMLRLMRQTGHLGTPETASLNVVIIL